MVPGGIAGEDLLISRDGGRPWSGAKAAGENSKIKRKDSATSATVGSARSRGRAHRDHREELLHEGDAGADANVIVALRLREQGGGVVPRPSRPAFTRKPYVIAFATPVRPEWRWRIVNYAGEMVEESFTTFPTIAVAVTRGTQRLEEMNATDRSTRVNPYRSTSHLRLR